MMQGIKRGITFGEKNSYTDWGLYLAEYPNVKPPTVQSNTVSVPGRDGLLNLTKSLDGLVHYESREAEFTFLCKRPREEWPEIYSDFQDYLHGQELRIVLDDDPSYFYVGQVEVDEPDYKRHAFKLTVTGTLDPYKYDLSSSLEDWLWDPFSFESGVIREYKDLPVDGTLEVSLIGSRRPFRPAFIVTSADGFGMNMTYSGVSYSLPEGRSIIPTMSIGEGEHTFLFTGHGTVSIDYRGGRL